MSSTARSNVATPYLSTSSAVEIAPEQAAGELRRDVAHQLARLARVVLDDAVDLLDRLAARPQLDRAQLQALHEDVGRVRHARRRCRSSAR